MLAVWTGFVFLIFLASGSGFEELDDSDLDLQELQLLQLSLKLHLADPSASNESEHAREMPLQLQYQRVTQEDRAISSRQTPELKHPLLDAISHVSTNDDDLTAALGAANSGNKSASALPTSTAEWITFRDQDPAKGIVIGDIEIGQATNESDISHYNIFWAANSTALGLIVSLPKGFYLHHLHNPLNSKLGVQIPHGANQLMVLTSNSAGMMPKGATTDIFDFWEPPINELLKGLLKGR